MVVLVVGIVAVPVEVGLRLWLENGLQRRELADLLGAEVGGLVEHQSVTVAEDVGREPTAQSETASTDDRSEATLHQCLTRLEVFAGNGQAKFLRHLPHGRNIDSGVRCAHDKRSTLCQCCVCVAHGRSDILAVVSLHGCLKMSERVVHGHIRLHINLCRCSPCHHDTCTVVLCLETADVLTQLLHHVPTSLAVLHVVAVKTFSEVLIKSSLERHNLLKFLLHGQDVLLLQHLSIHCTLKGVGGIHIPSTEYDVVEPGHRHNLRIRKILLIDTTAYTNLVILRH